MRSWVDPVTDVVKSIPSATVPFLTPPKKSVWNASEACPVVCVRARVVSLVVVVIVVVVVCAEVCSGGVCRGVQ